MLRKGQAGGGGEYGVQIGFGWTNGVILEFLDIYGGEISLDPEYQNLSGLGTRLTGNRFNNTIVIIVFLIFNYKAWFMI